MKKRIAGLVVLGLLVAVLALVAGCSLFNHEPTASFTWSPSSPFAATNVSFSSSSYDEDGTIVSYAWDFGDGGTASGATVAHKFADDGIYSVTLTVTDNDGAVGCLTKQVTVKNPAPIIGALTLKDIDTSSCCHNWVCDRIKATLSNVVDPASANADIGPKSVIMTTIDWGDGTGAGTATTHRYPLPGTYTVTAKVTDDDGAQTTKTATITIEGLVPPVVRLSPTPSTVMLGSTITFRVEAYDPDGANNCCEQCQPAPCPPPCGSCAETKDATTVATASFEESVFNELSLQSSSAENAPQGISIDPSCGPRQGNGIVRYQSNVEDPSHNVVVFEGDKTFSVCFDQTGTWIIRTIVWDDDCCHKSAQATYKIKVVLPDVCDPCPDPS